MSEVRCHRDHIFYGVLSKHAPGKVLWEAEYQALGIISIFISPGSNGAEQPGGRMPNTVPGGLQQACLKDPPARSLWTGWCGWASTSFGVLLFPRPGSRELSDAAMGTQRGFINTRAV